MHGRKFQGPRVNEQLATTIKEELAPRAVEPLAPTIKEELAPRAVEPLAPTIKEELAPRAVEPLAPTLSRRPMRHVTLSRQPIVAHELQLRPQPRYEM